MLVVQLNNNTLKVLTNFMSEYFQQLFKYNRLHKVCLQTHFDNGKKGFTIICIRMYVFESRWNDG